MTKLFNAGIYMPEAVKAKVANMKFNTTWTQHAQAALLDDRFGTLPPGSLSRDFIGRVWKLVEAELEGTPSDFAAGTWRTEKIVVRRSIDAARDIVLVIRPGTHVVVTAWINLTSDNHKTLTRRDFAFSL